MDMSSDVDDYLMNGNRNNVSALKNNFVDNKYGGNNNNPSCSTHLIASHNNRTVHNSSPVSENSQNILITSRDENDIESSLASDNDSDYEDNNAQNIIEKRTTKHGSQNTEQPHDDALMRKLCDEAASRTRSQVSVQNSSGIQIGDNIYFVGPVIYPFPFDKVSRRPENVSDRQKSRAYDNPAFENCDGSLNNSRTNDLGAKKDSTAPNPKEPLTFKSVLKKYKKYIIINTVGLLLLIFVVIGLSLAFRSGTTKYIENSGDGDQNVKENKDSNIGATLPQTVSKLRIVTRDEWVAQPPDNPLTPLVLPVDRVIITHTASENCDTQAQCVLRVRVIQTFHMESRSWDDIGYNFLVGGDGAVYEGRGWEKQGAHTKGYNVGSIGIAFIGTFTKHPPPQRQFDALKLILEEGVRSGKLTEDYKMYPHRAFFGTESPGEKVLEVIRTWPHYVGSLV